MCMDEATHKNILRFLGYAYNVQKNDANSQLLICSKYLPNRSLHKYIKGMLNPNLFALFFF